MLAAERRDEILAIVRRDKSAQVKVLSERYGVSGETIRKDLTILEQEGLLFKTYGGAYLVDGVINHIPDELRQTILAPEKDAIGRACAAMVHSGDTLFLDESTTCHSVARHLLGVGELTVLTNSLRIAKLFEDVPHIKLIMSGGELDPATKSFVGEAALASLGRYYVDKAFVSCQGLSMTAGITDGAQPNGAVRRLMMEHAYFRCLAADHTKIGRTNFYQICGYDLVDTIVVGNMPAGWDSHLAQWNIQLVECQKSETAVANHD